jgi:hypothetical protein
MSYSAASAGTCDGTMSTSRTTSWSPGSLSSRASSPGTIIRAADWNRAIRTWPRGSARSRSTAASALASAARTCSASAASASPASVSRMPRPSGSVSTSPTSAPRIFSCCEIADGV